jgi:acetoacetate decarboxylase
MFKFDENKCYNMPVFFGGYDYSPGSELHYRETLGLSFTYTTDIGRLSDYVPDCFEIIRPELNIGYLQCRQIDWMGGGSYNLIAVGVPVRFSGKRDRLEGQFMLVIWENKTLPIIGGREQNGMPKVFADIEDLHMSAGKTFSNASYEGNTFMRLEMTDNLPVEGGDLEEIRDLCSGGYDFGWRYIPKVNGPGAELSQPVLYPRCAVVEKAWTGTGNILWIEQSFERNPGQWNVINQLASLPMIKMNPVIMTKGSTVLKPQQGRVLE